MRRFDKNWKRKGYLTVESSVIFSLSVIVIGWMLSLCFHTWQRCWYTQAACETVLTGSFEGVLKGTEPKEKADEKWNRLKGEFYMIPENLVAAPSGNREKIIYKISADTKMWKKSLLRFQLAVSQKVIRPVNYIRKREAVGEVLE